MFVTVRSFHQHRNTIDAETSVLDFRSTETNLASGQFSHLSLCVFQFEHQSIKIRILRVPRFYFRNLLLIESDEVAQSTGFDPDSILQHSFSRSIFQCICNGAGCGRRSFYRHFQIENTLFVFLFIKRGTYFIVSNILFGSTIQVNIPFDTAQTPHILTLQISTRTPAIYFQRHHVLTFTQYIGNVPFGSRLRSLIIAEQLPVHPYIIERNHTLAAKYYPASFPVGGYFECTTIRTDFVFGKWYQRRILLEVEHLIVKLISFVNINRCSISLSFPVAGHINIRPSSGIIRRLVEVFRAVIWILYPVEFPLSVQAHIIRRLFISSRFFNIGSVGIRPYVGMGSEFIQSYSILALPLRLRLFLSRSEGSSQCCHQD